MSCDRASLSLFSIYVAVEFPHNRGHLCGWVMGFFEDLWADTAEVAVTPFLIVEHLNVLEDIGTSHHLVICRRVFEFALS